MFGQTIKVEIPEDSDLLNYDKTLRGQSPKVKAAINELIKNILKEKADH